MKPVIRRVGKNRDSNHRHEVELAEIAELDILSNINKMSRELANAHLDRKYAVVRMLSIQISKHYEQLFIALGHTEKMRDRLNHKGTPSQSQKFDYSRYDDVNY